MRALGEETTAAQGLRAADEKAQYDAACKRLLSEKAILSRIMKACLEEYRDCSFQDIADCIEGQPQVSAVPLLPDDRPIISGMDTEDKSLHEGQINYDIRFRAVVPGSGEPLGLIINVEAQNDFYPGYPLLKRGIYYGSRMISSQYGREFTGAEYQKIKKVYSIWICMNSPKYRQNTITRYRLTEEQLVGEVREPLQNYDLISVIMICLGDPDGENYDGVLRMLGVLFSNEASEAEKKRILEEDYGIAMTRAMESEVSVMCNLSKGVEEKGVMKGIKQGIEQGIERGIERGIEQGIEKGKAINMLSSIRNLVKNMGVSAEQAMTVLEVPEKDRPRYLELLAQQ